ncbi:MAG: DUF402 domain-containing protein [Gemmatimonadetes bacterium]|nr:DUF402 domain-containing protein [Gemmatimonadota bacterium]
MAEPPVVEYEYHRPGKGVTVYRHWLVVDRPDVKVLLMERYTHPDLLIDGRVAVQHGAPIVWFVFPGAWHDVGRFQLADGAFTGWYTNLCTPCETRGRRWSSTDLFLDLWMPANGEPRWQDEDEFQAAVTSGVLDPPLERRARAEREVIQRLLSRNAWPPPVCREIDPAFF